MSDLKSKKAQKGGKTFFNIKIRAEPLPEVKWWEFITVSSKMKCYCHNQKRLFKDDDNIYFHGYEHQTQVSFL